MKPSEDVLCRLFANKLQDSDDFRNRILSRTKFNGRTVMLLHGEQVLLRPHVKPENWWRHWWRKIPDLRQERETDIFVGFEDFADGSRFALHIENKQDAKFSPRYLSYSDFQTMLIAPESFRSQNSLKAGLFNCFVSYEDIGRFIPEFTVVSVA